jgi:hypothetical protein
LKKKGVRNQESGQESGKTIEVALPPSGRGSAHRTEPGHFSETKMAATDETRIKHGKEEEIRVPSVLNPCFIRG